MTSPGSMQEGFGDGPSCAAADSVCESQPHEDSSSNCSHSATHTATGPDTRTVTLMTEAVPVDELVSMAGIPSLEVVPDPCSIPHFHPSSPVDLKRSLSRERVSQHSVNGSVSSLALLSDKGGSTISFHDVSYHVPVRPKKRSCCGKTRNKYILKNVRFVNQSINQSIRLL